MNRVEETKRLYYSISDVARMIGVNPSTLRFWEKEFEGLHPRTTEGGTRTYTIQDIDYLRLIHSLLKEKKMKIDGAKKVLKTNKGELERKQRIIDTLVSIRNDLQDLANELG